MQSSGASLALFTVKWRSLLYKGRSCDRRGKLPRAPEEKNTKRRAERSREGDGPKVVQGLGCKLNPFPACDRRSARPYHVSASARSDMGEKYKQAWRWVESSWSRGEAHTMEWMLRSSPHCGQPARKVRLLTD